MRNQTSIQESGVAKALEANLKAKGFDWLPQLHQFRRSTTKGFNCLILSSSPASTGSILEAHIGLRLDAVENLAFPFTNGLPGFQPDSMTVVTPMARLYQQQFQRLPIKDAKDQQAAAGLFLQQLEEAGLPFLEKYNDLRTLNALFNATPDQPLSLVHNQINRCFRGVVLARLAQSPRLPKLIDQYRSYLKQRLYAPDQMLNKFQRLCHFLEHYSMN